MKSLNELKVKLDKENQILNSQIDEFRYVSPHITLNSFSFFNQNLHKFRSKQRGIGDIEKKLNEFQSLSQSNSRSDLNMHDTTAHTGAKTPDTKSDAKKIAVSHVNQTRNSETKTPKNSEPRNSYANEVGYDEG